MAGLAPHLNPDPQVAKTAAPRHPDRLSNQQLQTVAWLRWRIFLNSMRGKGAVGELVVRILSYPLVALMVFGPAVGAGFGSWYFVSHSMDSYLAIPLWLIFALWQFIGVSTSTAGPSFDLTTLTRFPIRYRDYFIIRLSFGLLDIPTLAGTACLIASSIGIGVAVPKLFGWALLTLLIYAAANILFSRMVYAWFERFLARRRTRELLTGLILVFSLAVQFGSQYLQRLGDSRHFHAPTSPWMVTTTHILLMLSSALPPGLATSSIGLKHSGETLLSAGALLGVGVYAAAFAAVLHIRLLAQYHGENLNESPATAKSKLKAATSAVALSQQPKSASGLLPPVIRACLVRETRYLLRSGTKLYTLVMPVFMILLFSFRNSGVSRLTEMHHDTGIYLFSYGCAYLQLIFVTLLYNSLGGDSSGVQFYFLGPVRFRDIMISKNLLAGGILLFELILMYVVSCIVAPPPALALTVATLAWTIFTVLINMTIGNVRSIQSPKIVDGSNVRRQNVSGMNSLISLVVTIAAVVLGAGTQLLCAYLTLTYWIPAALFTLLAGVAFGIYLAGLQKLDSVAAHHREDLIRELCRV